ncbi:MAG: 50S ribosomal protein L11 methyltransferase [Clostridia bacterium]|nr:50S ribosomal protein L11 methyltransferase [Clostridia bacterium]
MNWIEAVIYTTSEGIEPITGVLIQNGIESFVIEDPEEYEYLLHHPSHWDYVDDETIEKNKDIETNIKIYVEDNEEGKKALFALQNVLNHLKLDASLDLGTLKMTLKNVKDEDWLNNWKAYFKPIRITNNIIIKPQWEEYERQSQDDIVIDIEPGMAFGTGTHETTAMCIMLLEKYLAQKDVVLDVGCGSGILSIVAAKLGAEKVFGIDIDPVAVEVALKNVKENDIDDIIHIFQGDLAKDNDVKADIVVANIIADAVMMLSKDILKNLKGKKLLIASGIILEKENQVLCAMKDNGFEILEIMHKGEWTALVARGNSGVKR